MIKNIRLILIVSSIISSLIFGATLNAQESANYLDLTEIGVSAKTIGKGDVQGFNSTASGLFENPASIYRIYKLSTAAFMTKFMGEATYQNIALAIRMPVGVIGVGVMILGDDQIDGRDIKGKSTGYFGYSTTLYKVAYQYSVSRALHLGLSGNLYSMKMDTLKGEGSNIDIGVVLDGSVIDVSIVVKNIISSAKINYSDSYSDTKNDPDGINSSEGQTENLPLTTVIGARYKLKYIGLYGQIKTFGDSRNILKHAGVDFKVPFIPMIAFSGGYKEYYKKAVMIEGETGEKVIKSGTIGVGLDLFGINFDYAFERTMDNSSYAGYLQKHYFSVGLSF
jgi:hypothetical protein